MPSKVTMKIDKPEEIECTLTMTMPLSEWQRLYKQLSKECPAWDLKDAINVMITKAAKDYSTEVGKTTGE